MIGIAFLGIIISLGAAGVFMLKRADGKDAKKKEHGVCLNASHRNLSGLVCDDFGALVVGLHPTYWHYPRPAITSSN